MGYMTQLCRLEPGNAPKVSSSPTFGVDLPPIRPLCAGVMDWLKEIRNLEGHLDKGVTPPSPQKKWQTGLNSASMLT